MPDMNEFNQRIIEEYRANKGKVGGQFANAPLLLITATGAKTGRKLTFPLAYSRDGERLVIIASKAGAAHNPDWYHNLVANPEITVELGSEKFRARASLVTGEERDRLFQNQARQMPVFNDYQKKTTRQIPVFVLERI
jgi:deazaflavin-dependent oxidoreductase (nitroreductase family)